MGVEQVRFNGATLRTRGIRSPWPRMVTSGRRASMGPRLGRVEYAGAGTVTLTTLTSFNGATLRTRGIRQWVITVGRKGNHASMGPRLGRVEYQTQQKD